LAVRGIDRGHGAAQPKGAERALRGRDPVGLAAAVERRQHQSRVGREGARRARGATVVGVAGAVAQGFAVNGPVALAPGCGRVAQGRGMAAKRRPDRERVELLRDTADRRGGRRFPPRHAERVAQPGKASLDEAVDRSAGVGASDDRQDREQHDARQSTQLAPGPPWVLGVGQPGDKTGERRRGNLVRGCGGCQPGSQTDPRRRNPYAAITGRVASAWGSADPPGPNPRRHEG
jgi:hypothetical protein